MKAVIFVPLRTASTDSQDVRPNGLLHWHQRWSGATKTSDRMVYHTNTSGGLQQPRRQTEWSITLTPAVVCSSQDVTPNGLSHWHQRWSGAAKTSDRMVYYTTTAMVWRRLRRQTERYITLTPTVVWSSQDSWPNGLLHWHQLWSRAAKTPDWMFYYTDTSYCREQPRRQTEWSITLTPAMVWTRCQFLSYYRVQRPCSDNVALLTTFQ